MVRRKAVADQIQVDALVRSRRRCCICYGLTRDKKTKKGQIAHLDHDPNNNNPDNLAFMCLEHHDEYDSKTSQSKGLKREEVERYRDELDYLFGNWATHIKRDELLSFLAFAFGDVDSLVRIAIKAAGTVVFYGEEHAFDVLISDDMNSNDSDLYLPHMIVLDHFASWGWLTYKIEEKKSGGASGEYDDARVFLTVKRRSVCDDVAYALLEKAKDRKEIYERLIHTAEYRGWKSGLKRT